MRFDFLAALDTKGIPAPGQLSLQGIALFYQRCELDLAFGLCSPCRHYCCRNDLQAVPLQVSFGFHRFDRRTDSETRTGDPMPLSRRTLHILVSSKAQLLPFASKTGTEFLALRHSHHSSYISKSSNAACFLALAACLRTESFSAGFSSFSRSITSSRSGVFSANGISLLRCRLIY